MNNDITTAPSPEPEDRISLRDTRQMLLRMFTLLADHRDLRLGQLIVQTGLTMEELYHIEDQDLIDALEIPRQ